MINPDVILDLDAFLNEDINPEDVYIRANSFLSQSARDGYNSELSKRNSSSVKKEDDDGEESSTDALKKRVGISKEKDEEESEDEIVKTPDESPSTINLSDAMQYEKLVDVLNQFRASHSLSDPDVSEELNKYFEKLSAEEKKVLHVFLKGLVQVTLLDVDGKAAYSPTDLKFSISKKGSATSEKLKSIKRRQKSKEDAEKLDNAPIKIGESIQNKSMILKVLKENV